MNSDLAAAPFTWGYAVGAICFGAGFVLLAVATVAAGDYIERHVQRALGRDAALGPARRDVAACIAELEDYANGRTRNDR